MNTGPPMVPPKSLYRDGGRTIPLRLLKKEFAFNTLFRKNSYRPPWKALVPERVITLICPLELRPYSASYCPRTTRNSSIESTLGYESSVKFAPRSTLSAPSTDQLFCVGRPPFTEKLIWFERPVGLLTPT